MEGLSLESATLREQKKISGTWCTLKQRAAQACIEMLVPLDASDTLAGHEENHQNLIEHQY